VTKLRAQQHMHQRVAQTQRVTPRMVTAGALLQMSSEELQMRMEEESTVNPALELIRDCVCPTCGREVSSGTCFFCEDSGGDGRARLDDFYATPLSSLRFPRASEDDVGDPVEDAAAPISLRDYVLQQAHLVVPADDLFIAEHLISGLNDDGLLEMSVEEASEALAVPFDRIRTVLSLLQTLEPPGICSVSVQQCVLIQLLELAAQTRVPPLAEPIISRHWLDLANHSYTKIQRALDATEEEVQAAVHFIREKLHPYPGRLYHSPYPARSESAVGRPRPDVVVRREVADYVVEVARPFDFELRVSAAYQRLAAEKRGGNGDSPEYRLALEQCRRANWLVQSIAMREETLRQISEHIVVYQRPFLDTESEGKMKPLTRTDLAARIGKHPSTVSRAVANKFVLLPSGRLVGLDRFFSPAAAPKTVIAEVLSREDPERPLTDEQICRILRVRGFTVARRTVAKYRLALRLPSSIQRGRH